jgi:threonine dehydratase
MSSESPTVSIDTADDAVAPSFADLATLADLPTFADDLASDGLLSPALIAAATARIGAVLPATPQVRSARLDAWLKLESLQITGAFKVRGAFNALAAQVARGDRRAVVVASAGNHGLGVAWSAQRLGLGATVVVPAGASEVKVSGCRALGARIVCGGDAFESCAAQARAIAAADGARFLHAFDDPEVIAGQATVAAELLSLRPDVVVVPVGGGGLISGMGSVLARAGIRVVGAQLAGIDSLSRALARHGRGTRTSDAGGTRTSAGGDAPAASVAPLPATLADGLRVSAPGRLPLRIATRFLDEIVLVTEDEVAHTMAALAFSDKIVAEGAAAVAVAALARVPGKRRVAVVTGGNVDARVLARVLTQTSSPPEGSG